MNAIWFAALIAMTGSGCSSGVNGGTGGPAGTGGEFGTGGLTAAGGAAPPAGGLNGAGGSGMLGGQNATGGRTGVSGGSVGVVTGGSPGIVIGGAGGNLGGPSATSGGAGSGGGGAAGNAGSGGGAGGPASGGVAGAGGGAGGTPTAYQPCPTDGTPCKILPLGDSITWGVGDEGNGGYRGPLLALAIAAQQKVTFTGSLSNGPNTVSGQPFPKNNEGHSGWGISTVTQYSNGVAGIATVIPTPAFAATSGGVPNIILLHIGTNDTGNSTGAAMTDRLSGLMDKINTAAPNALLVVAKITPLSWANTVIQAYNDAMPDLVQTRVSAGKHVMLADMNTGFVPSMFGSDGIHPNDTGYKLMADRWYSVIGPLLPK